MFLRFRLNLMNPKTLGWSILMFLPNQQNPMNQKFQQGLEYPKFLLNQRFHLNLKNRALHLLQMNQRFRLNLKSLALHLLQMNQRFRLNLKTLELSNLMNRLSQCFRLSQKFQQGLGYQKFLMNQQNQQSQMNLNFQQGQ
jgi:hypothetical protein